MHRTTIRCTSLGRNCGACGISSKKLTLFDSHLTHEVDILLGFGRSFTPTHLLFLLAKIHPVSECCNQVWSVASSALFSCLREFIQWSLDWLVIRASPADVSHWPTVEGFCRSHLSTVTALHSASRCLVQEFSLKPFPLTSLREVDSHLHRTYII